MDGITKEKSYNNHGGGVWSYRPLTRLRIYLAVCVMVFCACMVGVGVLFIVGMDSSDNEPAGAFTGSSTNLSIDIMRGSNIVRRSTNNYFIADSITSPMRRARADEIFSIAPALYSPVFLDCGAIRRNDLLSYRLAPTYARRNYLVGTGCGNFFLGLNVRYTLRPGFHAFRIVSDCNASNAALRYLNSFVGITPTVAFQRYASSPISPWWNANLNSALSHSILEFNPDHCDALIIVRNPTTITPSAGVNGTVSAAHTAGPNSTHTFTATPDPGFRVASWAGGTLPAGNRGANCVAGSNSCTVTMPGVDHTLNVTFERSNYNVLVSSNDTSMGTTGQSSIIGQTQSLHTITATALPGHRFVNWTNIGTTEVIITDPDQGSNTGASSTTILIPNLPGGHVQANFERNPTTITPSVYPAGAGTVSPDTVQTGPSGSTTEFTATPANGWHFVAWRRTFDGVNISTENPFDDTHPDTGNVNLVAIFARNTTTITATSTIGGSVTPSGESGGLSGTTETFIAAPNTGFYFSGWSRTTGGPIFSTTNPFTDTRPDSGTVYLIANFTGFTGTVRFDRGSHAGITPTGNVPADQTRQSGQAWLSAGTHNLTIPGRHIVGWYTAAVGGFRVLDTDGTVVANPPDLIVPIVGAVVTLHARWSENTGTVRFNANVISTDLHPVLGNVPTSLTDSRATTGYTWTSNIQVSSEFRRIGFILAGWYTTASGEGARIFNANGTPVVGAPSLVMPTQGGYFDLFARWTANTGNLRFLPNAPTGPVPGPMPTQIVYTTANQLPASVALPGNFGRAHYWFLGFYDSPTGGTRIFVPNCFAAPGIPCNPSTLVLDGDPRHLAVVGGFTDLYARWAPAIWRADFDIREATSTQPSVQYLQSNETVTRPPDPVHPAGHSFVRWERQDRLGVEFNFDEPITSNVTLVAIFTPHVDIVIFNEQGGRGSVPYVPFTWGNPITAPPSPTRVGFVFSHWSLEQATETTPMPPRFNFATQIFYRMELFAVWIPSEHTVRIQWNDESGNIVYTEFIVSHGETIPSQNRPSNPTYPPYGIAEDARFLHWSMTPNGNHAFDFESTAVTRSFTLYAVWTRGEVEPEAGLN